MSDNLSEGDSKLFYFIPSGFSLSRMGVFLQDPKHSSSQLIFIGWKKQTLEGLSEQTLTTEEVLQEKQQENTVYQAQWEAIINE